MVTRGSVGVGLRSPRETRSTLIVAPLILAIACSGTDDEPASLASTIPPPSTDVVDTPTTISETPPAGSPHAEAMKWRRCWESNPGRGLCRPLPQPLGHIAICPNSVSLA